MVHPHNGNPKQMPEKTETPNMHANIFAQRDKLQAGRLKHPTKTREKTRMEDFLSNYEPGDAFCERNS